jgi:hypothetical protein
MPAALRRALWIVTALHVALVCAWVWGCCQLAASAGGVHHLARAAPLAYLALGPGASLAAGVLAWRWGRRCGQVLLAGGIGAAGVIWLGHVPDFGYPAALWCIPVVMVALGSAWLAAAAAQAWRWRTTRAPSGVRRGTRAR